MDGKKKRTKWPDIYGQTGKKGVEMTLKYRQSKKAKINAGEIESEASGRIKERESERALPVGRPVTVASAINWSIANLK